MVPHSVGAPPLLDDRTAVLYSRWWVIWSGPGGHGLAETGPRSYHLGLALRFEPNSLRGVYPCLQVYRRYTQRPGVLVADWSVGVRR